MKEYEATFKLITIGLTFLTFLPSPKRLVKGGKLRLLGIHKSNVTFIHKNLGNLSYNPNPSNR